MNDYLNFAKELAVKSGEIMLQHFGFNLKIEWKADASPVTVADKQINSLVISEVNKHFPSHSILGEEESDLKNDSEYLWVCDPIDGTYPYTIGVPCSCFSLALVKDGVPLVAVAYDPYMKRLISAVKGGGAFLNDQKIRVNSKTKLNPPMANICVDSNNNDLLNGLDFRSMLLNKGLARCPRLYSVVFSSMLVAVGSIDAVIVGLKTAHDVAAVKLFVEEAGGLVTDFRGNDQRYDRQINGALVSNASLHQELVDMLKPYLVV